MSVMKLLTFFTILWLSSTVYASSTCKPSISSLNKHARVIAQQVYDAGGNAIDAFVAATLVEYVVAPGVTSLAGPLSLLVGDDHGKVEYLDANSNDPIDVSGNWQPGEPMGKMVLAPTAPKGLHELWKRNGSLKWEQIVNPAIKIAEDGFVLDAMYGGILNANSEKLKRTPYGQVTYFNEGIPKAEGDLLKLPAMAEDSQIL